MWRCLDSSCWVKDVTCVAVLLQLQEDAHLAATKLPKNTDVFGVFDGHGGKEVAKFVALHFVGHPLQLSVCIAVWFA